MFVISQLPALMFPPKMHDKVEDTLDAYVKYRREQESEKRKREKEKLSQAVVEELPQSLDEQVDPEDMGASEDQYERMREIAPVTQPARMAFPKVPAKSDIDESKIEGMSMTFLDELSLKQSNPAYQEMMKFRKKLPAFQVRKVFLFISRAKDSKNEV